VLYQKTKAKEDYLLELIASFYERFEPLPIKRSNLSQASSLRTRYKIPYWDSLLLAGALELDASIFYSEDMQDGLPIEGKLTIVNPFK
jgi:predicted nucleic acid-binding protein